MAKCDECGYDWWTGEYGTAIRKFWRGQRHRETRLIWQCDECRDSKTVRRINVDVSPWRPGPAFWGSLTSFALVVAGLVELLAHTL